MYLSTSAKAVGAVMLVDREKIQTSIYYVSRTLTDAETIYFFMEKLALALMQAGAVVLTDCVFWFIIVPFLAIGDYNLNFLIIIMHSINAVFLIGDTALNSLQFPWFRIAYFVLWTCVFVVFQWIVHACIALWWPCPFLDLSYPLSPL
ncbi:uncharacterized protein LOC143565139 [Bidens hawaiensis]|uniref:uncharacterized protein LOC143565139 n=1 Tax=Bidens hawaiensis TaxID=980011 RepID=UPI00404A6DFE